MTPSPANPAAPQVPQPRDPALPYRICVVCLGNICRSPMAERVLAAELDLARLSGRVEVDSAGTGDWHLGEQMDARARTELGKRGYDAAGHQARQIQAKWLGRYDLVLAMDARNLAALQQMAPDEQTASRIQLMRDFDPAAPPGAQVPDPYYGDAADYAEVFDLVSAAAKGLTAQLSDLL